MTDSFGRLWPGNYWELQATGVRNCLQKVLFVFARFTEECMFCSRCGFEVAPEWSTCPKCGAALSAVPGYRDAPPAPVAAAMTPARFAEHIHLLAVLWFVWAGVLLIPALVMAILAGMISVPMSEDNVPHVVLVFVPGLFSILCVVFLAGAALRFVAAWGLLKRKHWGRTFALVMSFFELIHAPFGTLLGAYGLFVLLPANAAAEYDRLAAAGA